MREADPLENTTLIGKWCKIREDLEPTCTNRSNGTKNQMSKATSKLVKFFLPGVSVFRAMWSHLIPFRTQK